MATFFHGTPEIQTDGLQTLYLMNPSYVGYSDAGPAANQTSMVFWKSPLNSLNSIPQQPPHQQQHFVGIPIQPSPDSSRPPPETTAHDLSSTHHGHGLLPRLHYNLRNPTPSTNATFVGDVQMGPRRPGIVSPARQGLSLSLSPQQQTPFAPYRAEQDHMAEPAVAAASGGGEVAKMVGLQSVLMGSKYLKAAQQLLDEVVNAGKGSRTETAAATTLVRGSDSSLKSAAATKGGKDLEREGDGSGKKAADLLTAERQELQMKKTKLVSMLDEVEQRWCQYQEQMQTVVSSFEAVSGFGSARTYTALALQTISKQFRRLRDAISGQIRAASKSLGEEDCLGAGGSRSVGSSLRFVDHQLRQQRALQQLGMIQHNAWRPQRGLPERAVSVLRAWLFEHFLCPYPKDSDKHMLAKQTGLTRSQVSNWFINARVRLWKPMVEEMYMEETKEQEQNKNGGASGGNDNKISKSEASEQSASNSTSPQANSSTPLRTEQNDSLNVDLKPPPLPVHAPDLGMFDTNRGSSDKLTLQKRLKKAQSDESLHHQIGMEMRPDELSNRELLMKFMDHQGAAGFGGYPIGEIGRFDHEQFALRFGGNGVSLTLGLPHCEALSLSGSQQPPYLSNESMNPLGGRLELSSEENMNYFSLNNNNGNNNASASHAPSGYETINIQSRKRFAAQLLPDFVS